MRASRLKQNDVFVRLDEPSRRKKGFIYFVYATAGTFEAPHEEMQAYRYQGGSGSAMISIPKDAEVLILKIA